MLLLILEFALITFSTWALPIFEFTHFRVFNKDLFILGLLILALLILDFALFRAS